MYRDLVLTSNLSVPPSGLPLTSDLADLAHSLCPATSPPRPGACPRWPAIPPCPAPELTKTTLASASSSGSPGPSLLSVARSQVAVKDVLSCYSSFLSSPVSPQHPLDPGVSSSLSLKTPTMSALSFPCTPRNCHRRPPQSPVCWPLLCHASLFSTEMLLSGSVGPPETSDRLRIYSSWLASGQVLESLCHSLMASFSISPGRYPGSSLPL